MLKNRPLYMMTTHVIGVQNIYNIVYSTK